MKTYRLVTELYYGGHTNTKLVVYEDFDVYYNFLQGIDCVGENTHVPSEIVPHLKCYEVVDLTERESSGIVGDFS